MSTPSKWAVDFKIISQSFKNASANYGTENLVGLIFGRANDRKVTAVIFIRSDNHSLENQINQIISLFSPEVTFVGLARLSNVQSATLNAEEQTTLKFSVDELKNVAKSGRKLAMANPRVIYQSITTQFDVEKQAKLCAFVNARISRDTLQNCVNPEQLPELWPSFVDSSDSNTLLTDLETVLNETKKNADTPIRLNIGSKTFVDDDKKEVSENVIAVHMEAALDVTLDITNVAFQKLWSSFLMRILTQIQHILKSGINTHVIAIRSFLPPGSAESIHVAIPDINDASVESSFRRDLHILLNLSTNTRIFHLKQAISSIQSETLPRLINPHESLKFTPTSGGICTVVRGVYTYHHYRQDEFDDCGWGCAYRSFQTVWSWLRHRNITAKPVPTHREIQQCLVDIGDKKPNFVGSREWIGSLELSYCLENMLGITSRILPAKAGGESIAEHARAIIFHFENCGAPIMIGGGQYAYTILGIDYDIRMGKCQYLVLDPHYQGEENLTKIIQGGWCAWKPASFWNNKCFYNLLLPINPTIDIEKDL